MSGEAKDYVIDADNDNRSAQLIQVESSRLVPMLVVLSAVSLLVAGFAVGVAVWSLSASDKARIEARILQVKVEGFENALWANNIDPAPHHRGTPE